MTKQVMCGNVAIGGGAPISIQSMTNVSSTDEKELVRQISSLAAAGCDIVRVAVPDMEAAETLKKVKKQIAIPLVADIHFDYRLAVAAIASGADKIRINPGNIGDANRVREVVKAASERNIPIRVGVNSGSLEKDIIEKNGGVTAEGLAESALRNLRLIEDMGYDNLVVSLKSSDVAMNYHAHKIVSEGTEHPIHIGITEAGTIRRGQLKSAAGLSPLLLQGIGDTMRISMTADPVEEVIFAKELLAILGMAEGGVNIVSCPTCGRTKIDLQGLAEAVEKRMNEEKIAHNITIAVMGCAVNGPGEAKSADYGVAGGQGKGIIFSKGKIIKTTPEEHLLDELIGIIKADIK
ncbi:4-hydroxy-3-methylbut-2-en-1-yl diphosphate synthase [Peptostreptococcaceae bacterium pGA-8]|nr:4-hydroxy-3-methylbut-2-en-1-yl diphosphate synthase [Peptostreptococcaceae bacterium pGA-8]